MVALRTLLLVAVVLLSRGIVVAETTETGFLNRSVILDGVEYPYQIMYHVSTNDQWRGRSSWPSMELESAVATGFCKQRSAWGSAIRRQADRYPAGGLPADS